MSELIDIGRHRDDTSANQRRGCLIGAVLIVVVAGIGIALGASSGGDEESGPVLPTRSDEQTLATDLKQATGYQHICYGWQLTLQDNYSGHSGTTAGSNQGAGRPLDTGTCQRWVTLDASVTWTSSSSSFQDSGRYRLRASPNLTSTLPDTSQLQRIGFSQEQVVNNPSVAVENLMEGLPLLMAETGAAQPLPVKESAKPTGSAAKPVDVNSDKWRNHKGMLIFGSIAILGAIGCLIVGLIAWRRRRGERVPGGPSGPGTPTPPMGIARGEPPPYGGEDSPPRRPPNQPPNRPPAP